MPTVPISSVSSLFLFFFFILFCLLSPTARVVLPVVPPAHLRRSVLPCFRIL
ncbi:hypothetical protein CROQUDRAFT_654975, partial [Cronartium quercuum f. sp. fusiforme G11]